MIQPGQIDYQKQLDALKDLPVNEDSVEYLTGLSRNPSSPFVRFLVESRLEQLTKALQNQAGSQAQQAQQSAPQGTISDKIEQAAGIAALQAAQQRQAAQQMQQQASQPSMPIPEGVSQPAMQPEAEAGVASAPVDSEMFNFAPGGIVAFANPEKEKKQVVKEAEDDDKLDPETAQKIAEAMEKRVPPPPPEEKTSQADRFIRPIVRPITEGIIDPLSNMLRQSGEYAQLKQKRDAAIPGFFERLTPTELAERQQQLKNLNAQMRDVGSSPAPIKPVVAAPAPAAAPGGINTLPDAETQKLLRLAANPPAAQNTNPALQPNANIAPPPAPVNTAPKPPPVPGGGVPGGTASGIAATLAAMQKMPQQDSFNKSIEDLRKSVEGTSRDQKIADELALQKALGIGTFEQQQMKMYEDNKERQAKIDAGRGQRDLLAQLAAYSRPGANWSQVVERDIASKSAALMEDKQFADAQNKLLTDIQRTAEERRIGTANSIRSAEALEKKSKQEALHYIMQSQGVNLQVAQKMLADTLHAQVQSRGQDLQYQVGMANADLKNQKLDLDRQMNMLRFDQAIKQMEARNQSLLNNNKDYQGYVKMRQGLEQQLNYVKDEEKRAKIQEQIDGYNQKIANIATQIVGGGIGSLPQSAPKTNQPVLDFNKIK